mmetsp:Transcript_21823/g.31601  ORF Transcript_21823/g.31601 Transcript_21823/m.31601 type:complete len:86 (+) Transcript_21823:262-519(+)
MFLCMIITFCFQYQQQANSVFMKRKIPIDIVNIYFGSIYSSCNIVQIEKKLLPIVCLQCKPLILLRITKHVTLVFLKLWNPQSSL